MHLRDVVFSQVIPTQTLNRIMVAQQRCYTEPTFKSTASRGSNSVRSIKPSLKLTVAVPRTVVSIRKYNVCSEDYSYVVLYACSGCHGLGPRALKSRKAPPQGITAHVASDAFASSQAKRVKGYPRPIGLKLMRRHYNLHIVIR